MRISTGSLKARPEDKKAAACHRGRRRTPWSFSRHARSRSVATAHTPDYDLIAAPFADGHIATMVSASISPIIVVSMSPIVIVPIIVATFTLTPAVGSDTEVQLSERDRRLGRDRINSTFGECWESPHCASDGGNFPIRTSSFADTTNEVN